jgi:large subunit ribosomal protein L50
VQFLTKLINEFGHSVPNSTMSELKTVGDAIKFFSSEVRDTSTYEDLSARRDLPPNLSIQAEYLRFDPETDTMFGGRTAFPGRDTYVTSIKYRRKYSGVKNTKDKPGYINYYYGY